MKTDETKPRKPRPRRGPPEPPKTLFRKVFSRFKWPRKLRVTREGRYFLLITVCVGFGAFNTGNNLLYLLFGMFLSLILVSGVMSELSLRHLTVVRRLPPRAQVGRGHLVEIEVYNHKRQVPSYAIEVEDLRAGQPADKRCFFLKVAPGSSQVAAYRRTPARRGLDRYIAFRVATRFPFGFFEKSREIDLDGDLVIYPAVDPVRLPSGQDGMAREGIEVARRGTGDEILGLRPMREGDDPRDIYWKRSARQGAAVVRERAREVRSQVTLKLDNVHAGETPEPYELERFERKVREIASLTVAHLRRGDRVRVEAISGTSAASSPASGADPVLRFLALIDLERPGDSGAPHVRLLSDSPPEPPSTPRRVTSDPVVGRPGVIGSTGFGLGEEDR
jgi:uncharacterized protein (DUF58 family)